MSFLSVFFGETPQSKEDRDTDRLLKELRPLTEKRILCDDEAQIAFAKSVMEDAGQDFDATVGMRIGVPVYILLRTLLANEPLALTIPSFAPSLGLAEGVAFRNRLRHVQRVLADESRLLDIWRKAATYLLVTIYTELPEQAFVDPDENGDFVEYSRLAPIAPLYTYIKNVPVLIRKILAFFFAEDLRDDELFNEMRERLYINCAIASNIPVEERFTTHKQVIHPEDKRGLSDEELIDLYLAGTPFPAIFATPIPMYIPEAIRFEHTHVLAGTGHGKTQTLQFLIAGDLQEAMMEKRSVVVMDSQGDLLQTLMRSSYFDDSSLRERFIYIDPQDIERPIGLNLFDVDLGAATTSPVIRETILNGTIEVYEYFFGGLLGAELTQKQGVVFKYLAILMTRIPGANVHTLLELMENGEKFRPYIRTLQGSPRAFFETRFFDRTFSETKKQIMNRLWGVLSSQTLDRMMSATKNSVNLFDSLQNGAIVFINTAKDFLGNEGSSLFARMFVALLSQALMRRAAIPKHERTSTYIYIDEAEDVVDLTLTRMLAQVRKYKGAMTFAHQNLDQLPADIRAGVITNTSIKLAGGLSAKDAHTLAGDFRCDADFLLSQKKKKSETNFACFAKNVTDRAVTLSIPLGYVEDEGHISGASYRALLETSRQKYGVEYKEVTVPDVPTQESPSSWVADGEVEWTPPEEPEKKTKVKAAQPEIQPIEAPAPAQDIVITRAPPSPTPTAPRDTGGGGVKHKYIEHLIKELGEERGFRASIEESIHDGAGRVDVILRREEIALAFEISVTTTKDHELGNVEKCLELPFTHVAMLASHGRHLKSLSTYIVNALEEADKKRVSFLLPEDLPGFLDGYPLLEAPKEKTVKGYTVRTRVKEADPGEAIARRRAIAQVVARSIQG